MKILIKIFFLIFFIFLKLTAQSENIDLVFKAKMIKNDGTDQLTLFKNLNLKNVIEGYFLLPQYEARIEGKIQKGGFSFLDPSIFGIAFGSEKLRKEWVKNDFPVTNLENLTNGIDLGKIFSFYIIPEMRNYNDDFVILFFKYAIFNKLNSETHLETNQSFNIKFFAKKIKVPFGKDTSFNFINEHFKDYHFSFSIEKKENSLQHLNLKTTDKFFEGIKKSCSESLLLKNVKLNISAEFVQVGSDTKYSPEPYYYKANLRAKSLLLKSNTLIDDQTGTEIELSNPVYAAKLLFPFKLYNSEKQNKYLTFKTDAKIFQSIYNIVVVPISYRDDSLTVDLLLDYSKINIDDIPRWTPIKKRIAVTQNMPVKIDLPKENWTANFTRAGNNYNIYGYPDFEKFINEYLILSFDSIEIEKEN